MLNAGGSWYDGSSGGHLMIIMLPVTARAAPLVDSHRGVCSPVNATAGAHRRWADASLETYAPVQA
jgi:hypothetical protein